jgi:predicted secreted acid phosphatase
MDIVFDIDGTLADASHRLPHITNPEQPKNWDAFFDGAVNDTPIPEAWEILYSLLSQHNRIIFITGRPERLRTPTYNWLTDTYCEHRANSAWYWQECPSSRKPVLYMRGNGDRRPSSEVKRDLLQKARMDTFDPKIAFEDRAADAKMWRDEGLFCCNVNEGQF